MTDVEAWLAANTGFCRMGAFIASSACKDQRSQKKDMCIGCSGLDLSRKPETSPGGNMGRSICSKTDCNKEAVVAGFCLTHAAVEVPEKHAAHKAKKMELYYKRVGKVKKPVAPVAVTQNPIPVNDQFNQRVGRVAPDNATETVALVKLTQPTELEEPLPETFGKVENAAGEMVPFGVNLEPFVFEAVRGMIREAFRQKEAEIMADLSGHTPGATLKFAGQWIESISQVGC